MGGIGVGGVWISRGGGGDGDSTYTDTYANQPAAGNDGDLFFPSDGVSIYRDTGAAWVPWGPLFPLTAPPAAGWSWDNQNGSSVVTTQGGIHIHTPETALNSVSMYYRTAPSTPYTISVLLLYGGPISTSNAEMWGIGFRQSSDGKLVLLSLVLDGLFIGKWTDTTTFSAYYDQPVFHNYPVWLRMADDGANRIFSISGDGQNWIEWHSVGRADFLTADQVGIFLWPKDAEVSGGAGMTLVSWEEA